MMQKVKYIVTGVVLTLSVALSAQTKMIDGVVWIVGDNAIMRSEVEEYGLGLQ